MVLGFPHLAPQRGSLTLAQANGLGLGWQGGQPWKGCSGDSPEIEEAFQASILGLAQTQAGGLG